MIARVEKVLNSGVYGIKINNQIEVGYSNNIKHQWGKHRRALERTNHWNPKLQNAYNKYKNVEFFIIEECESWLPEKETNLRRRVYISFSRLETQR